MKSKKEFKKETNPFAKKKAKGLGAAPKERAKGLGESAMESYGDPGFMGKRHGKAKDELPANMEPVMEEDGKVTLVEYPEKKDNLVPPVTKFLDAAGKGMEAKPAKKEYSAKELEQRERDMKVNYSSVVPEKMRKQLDAERKENWKSQDEVKAMPQWKPVIDPVVDKVISERVKEVKLFMETIDRSEKEIVVTKLTGLVKKQLPDKDIDLIEKAIWRRLFDLAKDQGVSNIGKMKDVL